MITRKRSAVALAGTVLALSASAYAATCNVYGLRESSRPSSPGNGHCGFWGGTPPCGHHVEKPHFPPPHHEIERHLPPFHRFHR
jgi:hypothetical protein